MKTESEVQNAFVDTNVYVYFYDDDEPAKQQRARETLGRHPDAVASTQVLIETFASLVRKLGMSPQRARDIVATLAGGNVVPATGSLVVEAATESARSGRRIFDSMILCAAQSAGCTLLLSEDFGHGQTFGRLRVENPFVDLETPPAPPGT